MQRGNRTSGYPSSNTAIECVAPNSSYPSRNPFPFTASLISYADKADTHQGIVKESRCTPQRSRLTISAPIRIMRGTSVNLTPSERFLSYHVSESIPRSHSPRLFKYLRIDN